MSTVSVDLVNDLLASVEQLANGHGLSESMILEIHRQYREIEGIFKSLSSVEDLSLLVYFICHYS